MLKSELVAGATVMVDPAPEGDEREMILSIVKPEKPVPAAVGGREGEQGEEPKAANEAPTRRRTSRSEK